MKLECQKQGGKSGGKKQGGKPGVSRWGGRIKGMNKQVSGIIWKLRKNNAKLLRKVGRLQAKLSRKQGQEAPILVEPPADLIVWADCPDKTSAQSLEAELATRGERLSIAREVSAIDKLLSMEGEETGHLVSDLSSVLSLTL